MHPGNGALSLRVLVVDEDISRATSLARFLKALSCKTVIAFGSDMGHRIWQLFRPNEASIGLAAASSTGFDTWASCASPMALCRRRWSSARSGKGKAATCFDRSVSGPEEATAFRELLTEVQERLSAAEVPGPAG